MNEVKARWVVNETVDQIVYAHNIEQGIKLYTRSAAKEI
jgi:hypothetical protein